MILSRALLCAKESGTAGKIIVPVFRFAKDGIFLLPPLSKGRGTVAVRTVEGFCKDFRHNKKLSTKKNPLATAYAMWPSPL